MANVWAILSSVVSLSPCRLSNRMIFRYLSHLSATHPDPGISAQALMNKKDLHSWIRAERICSGCYDRRYFELHDSKMAGWLNLLQPNIVLCNRCRVPFEWPYNQILLCKGIEGSMLCVYER
jgi:hypothetical protein